MFELNMKPTRSNCFEIRSSDDALTTIDCRNEKHSQFELAGVTYSIEREPRWGDWVLSRDGHELCRATKPSAFSSRTQLALATSNRRLDLQAASTFGASYRVLEKECEVAFIQARGFFRRRGECRFAEDIDATLQVFVCWMTGVYWKRADDAAAATPSV